MAQTKSRLNFKSATFDDYDKQSIQMYVPDMPKLLVF